MTFETPLMWVGSVRAFAFGSFIFNETKACAGAGTMQNIFLVDADSKYLLLFLAHDSRAITELYSISMKATSFLSS